MDQLADGADGRALWGGVQDSGTTAIGVQDLFIFRDPDGLHPGKLLGDAIHLAVLKPIADQDYLADAEFAGNVKQAASHLEALARCIRDYQQGVLRTGSRPHQVVGAGLQVGITTSPGPGAMRSKTSRRVL